MNPLGRNEPLLELMLDATAARQRVIAQNLANVDTPNYKAKELRFERAFEQAIQSPDEPQAPRSETFDLVARKNAPHANGNDVDMEQELADANANALIHQTALAIVGMKTHEMRSAIAGRSI